MGAGALNGLFKRVAGQQTEAHGQTGLQRHLRNALGGFGADVVEMGSAAADDRSESDDAVVLRERGHLLAHDGQLIRAGNAHHGDVFLRRAVTGQVVDGAFHEMLNDEVVETRRHNGDLQPLGIELSFYGLDGIHDVLTLSWGIPA